MILNDDEKNTMHYNVIIFCGTHHHHEKSQAEDLKNHQHQWGSEDLSLSPSLSASHTQSVLVWIISLWEKSWDGNSWDEDDAWETKRGEVKSSNHESWFLKIMNPDYDAYDDDDGR